MILNYVLVNWNRKTNQKDFIYGSCESVSMKLSEDMKSKIINNNRKITELLKENESILREAGYKPPVTNYVLERIDRIGFPSRYIRTVAEFNEKYHLKEICPNRVTRHNITYALEVSDLINFVINRVNIWESVETIFYKIAVVNLVSIMEALILEAANNICCIPSKCGKINMCCYHFSKHERDNASFAIRKLAKVGILDFDTDKISRVLKIIELRNRIHIRLAKGNEMNMDEYTLELYNEVVILLQDIDRQIYEKAVPFYRCGCLA